MNFKFFSVFLVFLAVNILTGCYYDNEEDLYPGNTCVTDNMSYSSDVLPIIQDNCYTCHNQAGNQGGVTLEGYAAFKVYIDNGKLLGAIKHESGFQPMPQNQPKLIQCQIDKIQAWVDQGALNN